MKYNFLCRDGKIKSFKNLKKEIGLSWNDLNRLLPQYNLSKEDGDFLKKYKLEPTFFNIAVLQKLNMVYLFEADLKRIKEMIKNGKLF